MRTYKQNLRATDVVAVAISFGLGLALFTSNALATLPPGLNMWTTNEVLFLDNFGYGDSSGSMLVSNFHGWYQGPTGLDSSDPSGKVQFQTGAVPVEPVQAVPVPVVTETLTIGGRPVPADQAVQQRTVKEKPDRQRSPR